MRKLLWLVVLLLLVSAVQAVAPVIVSASLNRTYTTYPPALNYTFYNDTLQGWCNATIVGSNFLAYNYTLYKNNAVNTTGYYGGAVISCYQETANATSSCGGLSTGNYRTNINNSLTGELYINYTKPSSNTSAVVVMYSIANYGPQNFTLPPEGFNNSVISLKINSTEDGPPGQIHYSTINYWNNTDWVFIFGDWTATSGSDCSGGINNSYLLYDGDWSTYAAYDSPTGWDINCFYPHARFYEEGIYWNFTGVTVPANVTTNVVNFTINGNHNDFYNFSCTAFDGVAYSAGINSSNKTVVFSVVNISIYNVSSGGFLSTTNFGVFASNGSHTQNFTGVNGRSHNNSFSLLGPVSFLINATGFINASASGFIFSKNNNSNLSISLLSTSISLFIKDEITDQLLSANPNFTVGVITSSVVSNYTSNGSSNIIFSSTSEETTIRYFQIFYSERDYYAIFNNVSSNLTVYALNNTLASLLSIKVEDESGTPVVGATIKLLRYFISCNCYNVVEMDKTSSDGKALFWVEAVTGHYKWVIEYKGVTRFMSAFPETFSTSAKTFIISTGDDFYSSYLTKTNVVSSVIINNATGVISYIWNDPSALTLAGCISVRHVNGTIWETDEACSSGSAGSVLYTFPSLNATYLWSTYRQLSTTYSNPPDYSGVFEVFKTFPLGKIGVFLFFGLMLSGSFLFAGYSAFGVILWNSLFLLVGAVLSFGGFGIIPFGWASVAAFSSLMIGLGVFLMRR